MNKHVALDYMLGEMTAQEDKSSRKRMISYKLDDHDSMVLYSDVSAVSLDSEGDVTERPSEMVSCTGCASLYEGYISRSKRDRRVMRSYHSLLICIPECVTQQKCLDLPLKYLNPRLSLSPITFGLEIIYVYYKIQFHRPSIVPPAEEKAQGRISMRTYVRYFRAGANDLALLFVINHLDKYCYC